MFSTGPRRNRCWVCFEAVNYTPNYFLNIFKTLHKKKEYSLSCHLSSLPCWSWFLFSSSSVGSWRRYLAYLYTNHKRTFMQRACAASDCLSATVSNKTAVSCLSITVSQNTVKSLPLYDLLCPHIKWCSAVEHMDNLYTSKTGNKFCVWVPADMSPLYVVFQSITLTGYPEVDTRNPNEMALSSSRKGPDFTASLSDTENIVVAHWCVPQHELNSEI